MYAQNVREVLEWIPYNKFKNIEYFDKGGFSTIYRAIWLDGPFTSWPNDEKQFRDSNKEVTLKSLNKSSNLNEEFLNEVRN